MTVLVYQYVWRIARRLRLEDIAFRVARRAASRHPENAKAHTLFSIQLTERGSFRRALRAATRVIALKPSPDRDSFARLGRLTYRVEGVAAALAVYNEALRHFPHHAPFLAEAGRLEIRRRSYRRAAELLGSAISEGSSVPADWHYLRGVALERAGFAQGAYDEFCYAVTSRGKLSRDRPVRARYRASIIGRALGHPLDAEIFMREAVERAHVADEGELHDWLGSAHERVSWYRRQFYRVRGSARAGHAVAVARALGELTEWSGAVQWLQTAVSIDSTHAQWHFELAQAQEHRGDWEGAALSYERALERTLNHRAGWYAAYGGILHRLSRTDEALHAYSMSTAFSCPPTMEPIAFNREIKRQESRYALYLQTARVQENTILYESMLGTGMKGNPLALFRHLSSSREYSELTHVWVVDSVDQVPDHYRTDPRLVFVVRASDAYVRHLATAAYLVTDVTFPSFFVRRPEQRLLNTWHGTPWKTLGQDMSGNTVEHANVGRNLLHATHVAMPNQHTLTVMKDRYGVAALHRAHFAVTGSPRVDSTLSQQHRATVRMQLGLGDSDTLVLYAPTYRGDHANPHDQAQRIVQDVSALDAIGGTVRFRGHSVEQQALAQHLPEYVVPDEIDSNDLLAATDILVTDYSSILFDFMATGRPVILYVHDLESYQRERGLYFAPQELGCTVVNTQDELVAAVLSSIDRPEGASATAIGRFCAAEDGAASERVARWFMEDDASGLSVIRPATTSRYRVLMHGSSFIPNGISASFINAAHQLVDDPDVELVVAFDQQGIAGDEARRETFLRLPSGLAQVARTGRPPWTPLERSVIDRLRNQHWLADPADWAIYRRAMGRELYRMVADVQFDAFAEFEGYSTYWVGLMGAGSAEIQPTAQRVVWQHNDMDSERRERFSYLEATFRLYSYFHTIAGVSNIVVAQNQEALVQPFALDAARFLYVPNFQDPDSVRSAARAPLPEDIDNFLDPGRSHLFVTLGRLSWEKGHAKLIQSFAIHREKFPKAQLIIVGDGPLRPALAAQLSALGLDGAVLLAGFRSNPYPVLAIADTFVLASDYEGQPMVFYEAFALDKPVVATDIPASREVLGRAGTGRIVPNTVEGLSHGLADAELEALEPPRFSFREHNSQARYATLDALGLKEGA